MQPWTLGNHLPSILYLLTDKMLHYRFENTFILTYISFDGARQAVHHTTGCRLQAHTTRQVMPHIGPSSLEC